MTNIFWRHPCVNYIVSRCPPLHLRTVTHTRARNVANSQYHTADKSNKPSTVQKNHSAVCLPASLCCKPTSNVREPSLPLDIISLVQIQSCVNNFIIMVSFLYSHHAKHFEKKICFFFF
jgi:hypothetical protein